MKTGNSRPKLITEINMVPFIDIVLVLLIVFMIVTPMLDQSQLPIDLPKASSTNKVTEAQTISLAISQEGRYYIEGDTIAPEKLLASLRGAIDKRDVKAVEIRADQEVPFRYVAGAVDAIKQIGDLKVMMAVQGSGK